MIPKHIRTFASLIFVCLASISLAENWPGWRGPRGDGTSSDANVPLEWDGSSGKNIRWKTTLPGEGYSSPVIWGDRVFVGSCLPESKERVLVCVNRQNGAQLWQQTIFSGRLESKHALNSFASGTPATDGKTVFIAFLEVGDEQVVAPNVGGKRMIFPGQMVVAAFDMVGNHKWTVRPGGFLSAHGFCSNPVLFNDTVIVNGDHDGESYILALNKDTGETVWKTPRRHQTRSYVTPLLREIDGKTQMVLSGSKCVASFDPTDGSLNWHVEGPTEQFVASIVFDGENFFATGGYPTHHVMAIKPTGSGDVTNSHVSWHIQNVRCYVPSPVVVGNYLMVADDRGTANCFDTKTGERLWQMRMGKHYSTSLLAVNGLAYFIADDGVTKILRPGPQAEVLAENELGENVYSSPAVADGQLFIRSEKHLFCIARE